MKAHAEKRHDNRQATTQACCAQTTRVDPEGDGADPALEGATGEARSIAQLARKMNQGPRADSMSALSAMMESRPDPVQRAENHTGMPDSLKGGIEQLSGMDMSGVRVHYNSPEPAQIQAHAFTRGQDIHVGPGQERHLPHEGWHVVQQMQGRVRPTTRAGGVEINDNPGLEQEADRLGDRAQSLDVGDGAQPVQMAAEPGRAVAQRQVFLGNQQWDIEMGMPIDDLAPPLKELFISWREDDKGRKFKDNKELVQALRDEWWRIPKEETMALSTTDPLYQDIVSSTMKNHRERPYSIDALHENSPFMSKYLDKSSTTSERLTSGISSLLSYQTLFGKQSTDRPSFEISRVEMIKNPELFSQYVNAYNDISRRGNPNEMLLYSGHSTQGMDFISKHGHDPSYGTYDPKMKGHGAHGRGAYFTDRVDKAISYSSKDQGPDEERSFFLQSVLLGNSLKYTKRGQFRHRHHNEMVREDRSKSNKLRLITGPTGDGGEEQGSHFIPLKIGEGEDAPENEDMSRYHSLIGQETYESGSGLFGTIMNREAFDSTEYMIRNADQVYPSYRIYYKLAPKGESSKVPEKESSIDVGNEKELVIEMGDLKKKSDHLDEEEHKGDF